MITLLNQFILSSDCKSGQIKLPDADSTILRLGGLALPSDLEANLSKPQFTKAENCDSLSFTGML